MSQPYYDPRSGEPITAAEFIERYTASAFIHVERPVQAGQTGDRPSLRQFGPKCPGCSTAVAREGDVCDFCAQKPQYERVRQPMFNVGG